MVDDGNEVRSRALKLRAALYDERSGWDQAWKDVSDALMPQGYGNNYTGTALINDSGKRKAPSFQHILDTVGLQAVRVSAAGLLAGVSSPSQPWMRLVPADTELLRRKPVLVWLSAVEKVLYSIFARSNTYASLHRIYRQLLVFGTAPVGLDRSPNSVLHLRPMKVGEFAFSTDAFDAPSTFVRTMTMTSEQLVSDFGIENVSNTVRNRMEGPASGRFAPVTVIHLIEPRYAATGNSPWSTDMPFRSIYVETGGDSQGVLRESGFERMPVLVPRWDASDFDTYGVSPGMEVVGFTRQLDMETIAKGQVIDYQTRPPVILPPSLKSKASGDGGIRAGWVGFANTAVEGAPQPLFTQHLDPRVLMEDIGDVRNQIRSMLHADLFTLFINDDRQGITATEIVERNGEKLLQIGPMLMRAHNELLAPLVQHTFAEAQGAGLLPEPPAVLRGQPLVMNFISPLAQAQAAVSETTAANRLIAFAGQVAGFDPGAVQALDGEELIRSFARSVGASPLALRSREEVMQSREQQAEAAASAGMSEDVKNIAAASKDAAEARTTGGNSVLDLVSAATLGG